MATMNLARFRLCFHPLCCKGAVIPRGRSKPNGWVLDSLGLWCPRHAVKDNVLPYNPYLRTPKVSL